MVTAFVQRNFDLKKLVLNKWFWVVFSLSMFFIPLYKSVNRTLPPDMPRLYQIPDFTLKAENGKNFEWSSLRGRFVIVNFHFTRCPTICKDLMTTTQEIQKRVRGLGDKVSIISISVDPEFDKPEILTAHALDLKANPLIWRFLTGSKEEIEKVVMQHFKSPMAKDVINESSIFDIAHSGSFFLVDDEGWLRSTYTSKKNNIDKMMIDLGLMVNRLYYKK